MEFVDYYKALGVSDDASDDEIKRAYRKLARKYHPDVSKEPDAEAQFKTVGEAYETLKDPEKRQAYDELKKYGFKPGEQFQPPPDWQQRQGYDSAQFSDADFGDFDDFIHSIFGGGGFGGFQRQTTGSSHRNWSDRHMPRDRHAQLSITLEEAFNGGKKRVSFQQHEVNSAQQVEVRERALDVSIPAGVTNGQQLRLKGLGENTGSGSGDLYVEIQIAPHSRYHVDGKDVSITLPVSPWEAALGAKVTVPTLSGKVSLTIPANSKSGKRMRLKGRGLPGSPAGDQYVTLMIENPARMDPETTRLYKELQEKSTFNPRAHMD